jgi:hypothetical protein
MRTISRGGRTRPEAIIQLLILPFIASMTLSACHPTTASAYLSSAKGRSESCAPLIPHPDDPLALFVRILELPIHPLAFVSFSRDQHHQCARPSNPGRENRRFNILGIRCLVGLGTVDRTVPDIVPAPFQQVFKSLKRNVILMDVGDENVPRFVAHDCSHLVLTTDI